MDGDYYYVVEVAVCLTRDTPAAPACLPYGFARRDGLLTQSQCRHFPWHFRGGTIQLFANGENEYSKGRRVVYALIIGNEARSAQKVPRRKGTDFHSVSKWR